VTGTLHLLPVPLEAGDPARSLPRGTIDTTLALRHFLAENARSARAHLKAIGHAGPIAELHIVEIGHRPEAREFDAWLAPLRGGDGVAGVDLGLLSESGCPGIADPGADIVARARELGLRVLAWSGPCSPVLALMASGIPAQRFAFLGYLPQDQEELSRRIREVERDAIAGEAQVFIETPYRNEKLLEALLRACRPETRLCVAVGLTGDAERVVTLPVARWRALAPSQRPALARRPAVFVLGA
jgi:16S rRNA (cytidine1402-2'-O)-methyltransferase